MTQYLHVHMDECLVVTVADYMDYCFISDFK